MAFQLNPQLVRDALMRAATELPPLPNVLVKILQLTETSDSGTVTEIDELIRSDQAISSKLLRVVNSAYFGLGGQVTSVNQAVVILGFQQVRNLVLSVSMMTQFTMVNEKGKEAQLRLWEEAFGTANAAQMIAKRKKLEPKQQELAFVGGLLQNIGCLFMLSALTRQYLSVLEETENGGKLLSDVEMMRLSTHHGEVGQHLLTKWKMPEELILLIGRHEGPFAGDPIPSLYAVHIAERLAIAMAKGELSDLNELGVDPVAIQWLGFTLEEVQEIVDVTKSKVEHVVQMIGGLHG